MSKEELFTALAVLNDKDVLAEVERVLKREPHSGTPEAETRLITQAEAAKRLGVSVTTVWRLIKEKSLIAVSVRGKQRIQLASLLRFAGV
jgi:excisionase family DNA binding protein